MTYLWSCTKRDYFPWDDMALGLFGLKFSLVLHAQASDDPVNVKGYDYTTFSSLINFLI